MIIVHGRITIRADLVELALALTREQVARSRLHAGCIQYDAHRHLDNPLQFEFVERWSSMQTLKAHLNDPACRKFFKTMSSYGSTPPELEFYEAQPTQV